MARQIKLLFPTLGNEATATLLEKDAPQTCAAVWQALAQPLQTTLSTRTAAPEVHIAMPAVIPAPDGENSGMLPIPVTFYSVLAPLRRPLPAWQQPLLAVAAA